MDLSDGLISQIREDAAEVQRANDAFRQAQDDDGGESYQQAKKQLGERLAELNDKMNHYLAREYGKNDKQADYEQWRQSHQPFHWLAEFYGIIEQDGGFDVVIGNPPYVEYRKVKKTYTIKNYDTESCGNLYAMFIERAINTGNGKGFVGFIVPISITTTIRMGKLNNLYKKYSCWISNYAVFPQSLFSEVHQRNSIFIAKTENKKATRTTKYNKWFSGERNHLFEKITYSQTINGYLNLNNKIGDSVYLNIMKKLYGNKKLIGSIESKLSKFCLYYKNTGINNWIVFSSFPPKCKINGIEKPSSRESHFHVSNKTDLEILTCLLNSSIYYLCYVSNTNCRDLNPSDIRSFSFPESIINEDLSSLFSELNENQKTNSQPLIRNQKQTGLVEIQSFRPKMAKPIIDEMDNMLALHYGFTEEELDYIINYDIKYRMGLGR